MPLSFDTQSHGQIPIGFFNIDTDMILIENYFMFIEDFCKWITDWSGQSGDLETKVKMFVIENPDDIGNLMGAISGVVFTGFIGEVYKKFPFPKEPEAFRQKPEGVKNRTVVEKIIKKFAKKNTIKISISKKEQTITIGDYMFSREQFHEVIYYIWRGGMPRWTDDEKPVYVEEMMKAVIASKHWLFKVEQTDNH
jgi:hypothetical protein